MTIPPRRARRLTAPIRLAIAIGLLAASLPAALAQSDDAVAPREGDIYGHVKHQPTEADIERAGGAGGINTPSDANKNAVEQSVDDLLRQTDELDKAMEERLNAEPAGRSPVPPLDGVQRE